MPGPTPKPVEADSSIAPGRRLRSLLVIATAFVVAAFALGMLIGPRVSEARIANEKLYAMNFRLSSMLGITLNRDFIAYVAAADQPARLLRQDILQARPLLPLIAAPFIGNPTESRSDSAVSVNPNGLPRALIVFAAINLFLAAGAIALTRAYGAAVIRRTRRGFGSATVIALAAASTIVLFNALASTHIWQPHTQMFTPFVAALLVWWLHRVAMEEMVDGRALLSVSAGFGVGLLAYGAFVMAVPVFLCALAWRRLAGYAMPHAGLVAGCVVLVVLPWLAWSQAVEWFAGGFYSHEFERYRQLVWMLDAYRAAGLRTVVDTLLSNAWFFGWYGLKFAASGLLLPMTATAFAGIPAVVRTRRSIASVAIAPVIVSIVSWLFFAAVGYRAERLAYATSIPLMIACAVIAAVITSGAESPHRARVSAFAIAMMMISLAIYLLFTADLVF